MDKEILSILAGIALCAFVLIGGVAVGNYATNEQKLRCIGLLKDKPAAEIAMVCK